MARNINYICVNIVNKRVEYMFFSNELNISSRREINIKKDDRYVLYQPRTNDDNNFIQAGVILSVEHEIKEDKDHLYKFQLKQMEINTNYGLIDQLYSLECIYNYKEPFRHFVRYYRFLSREDYETIVNGYIFYARTIFGFLFNVLPEYHQINILRLLIEQQGMKFFMNRDYKHAISILRTYIHEEIETRGEYLVAADNLLRNNFIDLMDVEKVGFLDEEDNKSDLLRTQADLFRELELSKSLMNEYSNDEIMMSGVVQDQFNRYFRNVEWPIQYKGYVYDNLY